MQIRIKFMPIPAWGSTSRAIDFIAIFFAQARKVVAGGMLERRAKTKHFLIVLRSVDLDYSIRCFAVLSRRWIFREGHRASVAEFLGEIFEW